MFGTVITCPQVSERAAIEFKLDFELLCLVCDILFTSIGGRMLYLFEPIIRLEAYLFLFPAENSRITE